MAGVEKRNFDSPDESRTPDKTRTDVVHMGGRPLLASRSSLGGRGRSASSRWWRRQLSVETPGHCAVGHDANHS